MIGGGCDGVTVIISRSVDLCCGFVSVDFGRGFVFLSRTTWRERELSLCQAFPAFRALTVWSFRALTVWSFRAPLSLSLCVARVFPREYRAERKCEGERTGTESTRTRAFLPLSRSLTCTEICSLDVTLGVSRSVTLHPHLCFV